VSISETAYEPVPIAVDIHSDMQLDLARHGGDPERAFAERHVPGLDAGNVRVTVLSTVSGGRNPTASALRNLAATRAAGCRVVETGADLDGDARIFILGLEGAEPYQTDLGLVEAFHWLGVRIFQLAWVGANAVTGTCAQASPTGITPEGRAVLRRIHELGAIVDLAHISDDGFRDAIDFFEGPLMCSHTCARTLCRHARNLTDDQIGLLAERGGLIGVCCFGQFLDEDPKRRTIERVVDHAEHLIEVAGVDHVALGPDWLDYAVDVLEALSPSGGNVDVGSGFPPGLSGPEGLPVLYAEMQKRGLPADKIFSLNALKFLRAWLR
jgi:membrane dipeptidase